MGGAYLSRPVKDKCSEVGNNSRLSYGLSSMQGWRLKQEDAHNCIIDFDENASFFGVYDGHGGFEVAKYTSENFPDFLKNTEKYKQKNYKDALIEAFLGFDDTISTSQVIAVLKEMVNADNRGESECDESPRLVAERGSPSCSNNSDDCDEDLENPETLRADANKPIEEVIASYQVPSIKVLQSESSKPSSPYLRGRRESSDKMNVDAPSSSTACCSSTTSGLTASNSKSNMNVPTASSSSGSRSLMPSEKEHNADIPSGNSCVSKNNSENSVNGSFSRINGDTSEGASTSDQRPVAELNSDKDAAHDILDTSPKKSKKLALDDLDDSAIIKNFITNDEIAEDDEDDSEDETFLPADDTLDSDDDDVEDCLPENTLAKRFLKCLHRVNNDDDDDDSEDDDEEDDNSEDDSSCDAEKDSLSDDDIDEGIEEEDDDCLHKGDLNDEEDDSECDDEVMTAEMLAGMSEKPGIDSGCTAVVALLQGDDLYVANAGDSRCVVCKSGQAVDMSEDHKPEDELEYNRILKAGGNVTSDGRVNGGLNLSRAIGDHCYKKSVDLPNTDQMITALPDVRTMKLDPDVEFIVLACDGIWNSMTSQEVVDFVRPKIQENMSLSDICEQMFDKCLAPDTYGDGVGCDNMTCIIVKPVHSGDKTSTTLVNGIIDSSTEIEAVSATDVSKTDSKSENVVPEPTANNKIAGAGDSLESTTNGDEQQCPKAQKRCAEDFIGDEDHNKRQKTNNTSWKSSLQPEEVLHNV